MKWLIRAVALSGMAVVAQAGDYVSGYFRSNGTYVSSHYRSSANNTVRDNYTYKGNRNPYTGSTGSNYYRSSPSSGYYNGYGSSSSSYRFRRGR